jgi:hypothetical protein
MQGITVFVRVNRDRADSQFVRRAKDAYRDFAAVGNQQLPKD